MRKKNTLEMPLAARPPGAVGGARGAGAGGLDSGTSRAPRLASLAGDKRLLGRLSRSMRARWADNPVTDDTKAASHGMRATAETRGRNPLNGREKAGAGGEASGLVATIVCGADVVAGTALVGRSATVRGPVVIDGIGGAVVRRSNTVRGPAIVGGTSFVCGPAVAVGTAQRAPGL